MYMLNGWWFLSSGGSYPLVFMVVLSRIKTNFKFHIIFTFQFHIHIKSSNQNTKEKRETGS